MCFYALPAHMLFMVMIMKRRKQLKRHRLGRRNNRAVSVPILFIAAFYLGGLIAGCCSGTCFEMPDTVFRVLTEQTQTGEAGLFSVLGGFGIYGLFFLILSTSYIGFLLVPPVFAARGLLTGALLMTYLQQDQTHVFEQALIAICLPELLSLSALILLGSLCACLSYRLLCRFRGAPIPFEPELPTRVLAEIFVLFLVSAFTEAYVVPFLMRMVSA